jgi:hypothetical protein
MAEVLEQVSLNHCRMTVLDIIFGMNLIVMSVGRLPKGLDCVISYPRLLRGIQVPLSAVLKFLFFFSSFSQNLQY